MSSSQDRPHDQLRIHTPCPKKWEELTGKGRKRFCDACSLHVHDAAQMKREEAHRLVAESSSRVCMRIELDAQGRPLYLDTRPTPPSWSRRIARWTLTATAGLLAACYDGATNGTGNEGGVDPTPQPGKLGQVSTTVLGDVAAPRPPDVPLTEMGEAVVDPEPVAPQRVSVGRVVLPQPPVKQD